MKEAIIKEIRREDTKAKDGKEKDADANANKKKRLRINNNKEKVDINNASNFQRGGDNRGGVKDLMPAAVSKVPVVVIITKVATRTTVTTITGIVSRNRSSSRRLARKT